MPESLIAEIPVVVKFKVKEEAPVKFKIDSTLIVGEGEPYEGEYIITPLAFTDQILDTKNKVLTEDIVVQKVPKYETSNVSGGYTVYIAEG